MEQMEQRMEEMEEFDDDVQPGEVPKEYGEGGPEGDHLGAKPDSVLERFLHCHHLCHLHHHCWRKSHQDC